MKRTALPPPDGTAAVEAAYELFYRESVPKLMRFAVSVGCPDADVRDVVQETLITAYHHWHEDLAHRSPGERFNWLKTTLVRNVSRVHRRGGGVGRLLAKLRAHKALGNRGPREGVEATVIRREIAARALAHLTEKQRIAVVLLHEGHTISQIAAMMEVTESAVTSHLHNARRKLSAWSTREGSSDV